MLVVSDASPVNVLIRIGQINVLPILFKAVVVPTAVAEEMSQPATPQVVRDWLDRPPPWFSVRAPSSPIHPSVRRRIFAGMSALIVVIGGFLRGGKRREGGGIGLGGEQRRVSGIGCSLDIQRTLHMPVVFFSG